MQKLNLKNILLNYTNLKMIIKGKIFTSEKELNEDNVTYGLYILKLLKMNMNHQVVKFYVDAIVLYIT